jgi:hypothetical protein
MAAQHHVAQAFPFHDVDDIGDVGLEPDVGAQQMRALAEPGERRREHGMAAAA